MSAVLVAIALVLAGMAWIWGNPPGGAPDELSHYVKALGVGGGDLAGRPPGQRPVTRDDLAKLAAAARAGNADSTPPPSGRERVRLDWMQRQSREFTIPRGLAVNIVCSSRGPERLTCLEQMRPSQPSPHASTPMGTYQPLPYLIPGLAARTAGDPMTAVRLGRLAGAILCLGLIGLAAAVVARGGAAGRLALVGLVAAISPAVLIIVVALNPSGFEVAGGLAFASGVLAVTRPGGRWWGAWVAVGLGGILLASSRSFGPLFVAISILAVAALRGRSGVRHALAHPRMPAVVTTALVAAAAALNLGWEWTQQPHPGVSTRDIGPGVRDAAEALPDLGRQLVGVFGAVLDITMPIPVYLAWAALVLGVVGLAVCVGDRRERGVLAALALLGPILIVALAVAVRPTGFPLQTRHLLPALTLLPLTAGEVLRRHAHQLPPRTVRDALLGAVAIAVAVHVAAWYVNARGWSGASAAPQFLVSGSRWSPPGTWVPWSLALLAAGAAYLGAARVAPSPSASSGPRESGGRERWAG